MPKAQRKRMTAAEMAGNKGGKRTSTYTKKKKVKKKVTDAQLMDKGRPIPKKRKKKY